MTMIRTCTALIASTLLWAPFAAAQEDASPAGVEITRDAVELQDVLEPRHDIDFTDSAVVFTNASHRTARVSCVGYNGNGRVVGRIWMKVPARGVRFALASDLSHDADFVGSAQCWTRSRVIGSAFLLRPGDVTDLPSRRLPDLLRAEAEAIPVPEPVLSVDPGSVDSDDTALLRRSRIYFPVVATY